MPRGVKGSGKAKWRRGRRSVPGQITLPGLRAYRAGLASQRDSLDAQLQAVDTLLRTLGGGAPITRSAALSAGPVGERVRGGSLKEFVLRALAGGEPMSVKDITASVVAGGYESRNKTLAKSVGIALTQLKTVRKLGRGTFQLK